MERVSISVLQPLRVKRRPHEALIPADDDGLPAADVGSWAELKYRIVRLYAKIFSTGMKEKWRHRIYIDLFAGSGHAVLRQRKQRVLTSPLLALTVPHPFDRYIFCDQDGGQLQALMVRAKRLAPAADVHCIEGDVNLTAGQVAALIPTHSRTSTVLSFCFVDPFNIDVHFDTIKLLGQGRAVDFLILLMISDARRNWQRCLNPHNGRLERLLGNPAWRQRWTLARSANSSEVQFLAQEYMRAMATLGYLTSSLNQMIEVRLPDNNVPLYYLAFFSRSERGYDFWNEAQKYSHTISLGWNSEEQTVTN